MSIEEKVVELTAKHGYFPDGPVADLLREGMLEVWGDVRSFETTVAELERKVAKYRDALETIARTYPRSGMDPDAKVGDNSIKWNVHMIAAAALSEDEPS